MRSITGLNFRISGAWRAILPNFRTWNQAYRGNRAMMEHRDTKSKRKRPIVDRSTSYWTSHVTQRWHAEQPHVLTTPHIWSEVGARTALSPLALPGHGSTMASASVSGRDSLPATWPDAVHGNATHARLAASTGCLRRCTWTCVSSDVGTLFSNGAADGSCGTHGPRSGCAWHLAPGHRMSHRGGMLSSHTC